MQLLILSGRVGNVKDARQVGDDRVMSFGLAIDNGRDKDPTWYDCELWGKRADSLGPHISKGMSITVQGRPKIRVHEGKGYQGISIDQLTFGGGKQGDQRRDDNQSGGYGGQQGQQQPSPSIGRAATKPSGSFARLEKSVASASGSSSASPQQPSRNTNAEISNRAT